MRTVLPAAASEEKRPLAIGSGPVSPSLALYPLKTWAQPKNNAMSGSDHDLCLTVQVK